MTLAIPQIRNIEELLIPYVGNGTISEKNFKQLIGPGENYGSQLVEVELVIEKTDKSKENLNIIAKLCPPNEWLRSMFACSITFKQEINFYSKIVPTLIEFQRECKVQHDKLLDIFPKCINGRLNLNPNSDEVDDDACLVLENLKIAGYRTVNRMIGLNLEEAAIVLRDLARFHAVPLAYKIRHQEHFKQHILPLLTRVLIGAPMLKECEDKFITSILSRLKLNNDEKNRFVKGMHKGFVFQMEFPTGDEKYATMVHCDFWLNNTMIKFDGQKPVHNKMLDFQVVTYGAPASDVVFFLFTSIKLDILEKHYDQLLQIYYKEFIDCLKSLQCDISTYNYQEFLEEINRYGALEASHILIMLKAVFSDSESVQDMEKLNVDDMFTDVGITYVYREHLEYTVQKFFEKNWF